jgi:hypothetical protein
MRLALIIGMLSPNMSVACIIFIHTSELYERGRWKRKLMSEPA